MTGRHRRGVSKGRDKILLQPPLPGKVTVWEEEAGGQGRHWDYSYHSSSGLCAFQLHKLPRGCPGSGCFHSIPSCRFQMSLQIEKISSWGIVIVFLSTNEVTLINTTILKSMIRAWPCNENPCEIYSIMTKRLSRNHLDTELATVGQFSLPSSGAVQCCWVGVLGSNQRPCVPCKLVLIFHLPSALSTSASNTSNLLVWWDICLLSRNTDKEWAPWDLCPDPKQRHSS